LELDGRRETKERLGEIEIAGEDAKRTVRLHCLYDLAPVDVLASTADEGCEGVELSECDAERVVVSIVHLRVEHIVKHDVRRTRSLIGNALPMGRLASGQIRRCW
jgi:hypothetical protein